MGIDPSGQAKLVELLKVSAIQSILVGSLVPVLSGISRYYAGGSFWYGAYRGSTTGVALTIIGIRSGGVFNPKFGSAVAEIVAGGVFSTALEWLISGGDKTTLEYEDDFWNSANAIAIGKATSFLKGHRPSRAAAIAFADRFVKGTLLTSGGLLREAFAGNGSINWTEVGNDFIELAIDSAWAAAKSYSTSLVNNDTGFEQLGPVFKQFASTVIWGGWKVLINNAKDIYGR